MLVFRVWFITMGVFWFVYADEYRKYSEINVKLINNNDGAFESKMRKLIKASGPNLNEIIDGILSISIYERVYFNRERCDRVSYKRDPNRN